MRSRFASELRVGGIDVGRSVATSQCEPAIYQPQQSVLKPQPEQRQTACIRYISAPQRSQMTLSSAAAASPQGGDGRGGALGVGRTSGMGGDYS